MRPKKGEGGEADAFETGSIYKFKVVSTISIDTRITDIALPIW